MAASEAELNQVVFHSFGDKEFNDCFSSAVNLLEKANVTVGQLWNFIQNYEKKASNDDDLGLLKYLCKVLK